MFLDIILVILLNSRPLTAPLASREQAGLQEHATAPGCFLVPKVLKSLCFNASFKGGNLSHHLSRWNTLSPLLCSDAGASKARKRLMTQTTTFFETKTEKE